MLRRLKELPEEKEKRVLVSGEGQEALLLTYLLANHKRLKSETQNLSIYLVHKPGVETERKHEEDAGLISSA